MADKKRITRRTALGLIAVGGFGLGAETFGFSEVTGTRGASVNVADDDANALLGIAATGGVPDNQNDADVVEITNNASEDFGTLDTDVDLDDPNGALQISDPFAESLDQNETTGLELTCDGGGSDTATVTVDAAAAGQRLQIDAVEFSHTFNYSCTGGGGGANLEILDVRGLGNEPVDHEYEVEIDVEETENEETENFEATLEIVGDEEGVVYDETLAAPDDLDEIENETVTIQFDDIGTLPEDDYTYTVTADADNAVSTSESGSFVVTDDDLPADLVVIESDNEPTNSDITFTVENVGETAAVVEAISWEDTTNDRAVTIERDDEEFIRTDGAGWLAGVIELEGPQVSMDETATVEAGQTAEFRLGRFRRNNGNATNMNRAEATIVLYLADDQPDQELVISG